MPLSTTLIDLIEKLAPIMELPSPKNDNERIQLLKMMGLVLVNGITFYNVIGPIRGLENLDFIKIKFSLNWRVTLLKAFENALKINYDAVFVLCFKILLKLADDQYTEDALDDIIRTSQRISSNKVLLRHDLMGRIYHLLLFKKIAKHLATYYTKITTSWLLSNLVIWTPNQFWLNIDWSDPESLKEFKIADFACGSGTLLSGIYRALQDKFIKENVKKGIPLDLKILHKILMENIIYGFDVLSFATHMALTSLALHNPDASFDQSNFYTLPLGKLVEIDLGSLDFLDPTSSNYPARSLNGEVISGIKRMDLIEEKIQNITISNHSFDIVIMNPPFARSCGDNLLFGNIIDKLTRKEMNSKLKNIRRAIDTTGIGQAGLGADFFFIADKYIKSHGRIAFVIPKNLLMGSSWRSIRELLSGILKIKPTTGWEKGNYFIEYIIISMEEDNYNFSENTDLSECLIVARKLDKDEIAGKTLCVILWKQPKNEFESLIYTDQIVKYFIQAQSTDTLDYLIRDYAAPAFIKLNQEIMGSIYAINQTLLKENLDNWGKLLAFKSAELTKIDFLLRTQNIFQFPKSKTIINIPLIKLNELATVGPDRKQIHNNFRTTNTKTIYPVLWGRDMDVLTTLEIAPNKYLHPKPGIQKQKIENLIKQKSIFLIPERIWMKTAKIISITCEKAVLSNVFWPVIPTKTELIDQNSINIEEISKLWNLWTNSILGIILYLGNREETRGPWLGIKKGMLLNQDILDFTKLTREQIDKIIELYNNLKDKEVPIIREQLENHIDWRFELDMKLVEILFNETPSKEDLKYIYNLMLNEVLI